jgi:hypothetical protein
MGRQPVRAGTPWTESPCFAPVRLVCRAPVAGSSATLHRAPPASIVPSRRSSVQPRRSSRRRRAITPPAEVIRVRLDICFAGRRGRRLCQRRIRSVAEAAGFRCLGDGVRRLIIARACGNGSRSRRLFRLWWKRKHSRFAGFVRGLSGSRERRLHNPRHRPRGQRTFDLLQGPERQAETD